MAVISRSSTRGKLPRGPHQLTDEQVAEDQHRRLIGAMVTLAGKRGYAATTVADIIKRAEVSRKTFYEHFKAREDLLLAAFDATSSTTFEEVRAAAQRTGGPTRQLEALMRRLSRTAHESPGTIALCTIEIAAVDPRPRASRTVSRQQLAQAAGLSDSTIGLYEQDVREPT